MGLVKEFGLPPVLRCFYFLFLRVFFFNAYIFWGEVTNIFKK